MHYTNLLIWQYRNKPKAIQTIRLLEQEITQGFIDLYQLQDVLNIDTAIGVNLDLVGKHIGLGRVVNNYILRTFFGFRDAPNAKGFSKRLLGGGQWYRKRDPLSDAVRLGDEDYRFLLKSRILKNYQTGTLPNIIEACQFIFGDGCNVVDHYDMSVTIYIPKATLTDFKKFAVNHLDLLPRQAGVQFNYEIKE